MRWAVIFGLAFLLAAVSVHAACPDIQSKNTQDLLTEIPSINSQLQGCPVRLPGGVSWLVGNGATVVDIQMNDGSTENLLLQVQNKQVTGVSRGTASCKYKVVTTESVLDAILKSPNRGGATMYLLGKKGIVFQGCTFWTKFKTAITAPIGRTAASKAAPSLPPGGGKPDNCDETWIQGHRGYAQNKATWDGYSANTDGVCQSQYGRGTPSPCVHTVQLSVSGNPYYLCWYNN